MGYSGRTTLHCGSRTQVEGGRKCRTWCSKGRQLGNTPAHAFSIGNTITLKKPIWFSGALALQVRGKAMQATFSGWQK